MLRAAGDPTRLRLLLLLRQAELTVSELIEIVGQSQPRVSLPIVPEPHSWSNQESPLTASLLPPEVRQPSDRRRVRLT